MHRKMVTPKQKETYDLIRDSIAQKGESPTIDELRRTLGLNSLRSVTQRLEALEAKGLIKRNPFQHRGMSILEPRNPYEPAGTMQIPVIASAGCDAAQIYAEQLYGEYIAVDRDMVSSHQDVVAVKAMGNSMADAGIRNGDYVLVEVTEAAENGDRVVAILGDMAVIKRLQVVPGAVILNPESRAGGYSPIVMREDFKIFGRVLSVIPASYRREDDIRVVYH